MGIWRFAWRVVDRIEYSGFAARLSMVPSPRPMPIGSARAIGSVFGRRFLSSRPIIMVKGARLGYIGQCQDRT